MSKKQNFTRQLKRATLIIQVAIGLTLASVILLVYFYIDPTLSAFMPEKEPAPIAVSEDRNKIEDGIHVRTGLIEADGLMAVVNNCTNCHSSKLVIQNRMNAERWNATIKWMQETQNLWDLGDNQEIIVNYLVSNYPPKSIGRRQNLAEVDWYVLED
ncbi:MAG: hypothetical protein ACI8QD_000486 [Cyclobacteriaceae bacterium]|jgi:hypothetical protein